MELRWYKEFGASTDDEKKHCRQTLFASKHVLDHLINILEKEKEGLNKPKKDDYDCPSWAYKQAHENGELACLNKVINLLTIKDSNNDN